jgi:hypothetical protein
MSRGRNYNGDSTWNRARDSLESDRATSRRRVLRRAKQLGHDIGPAFFVPSFGVRRPIIQTPELKDFVDKLHKNLPRNYRVKPAGEMALTILEQRLLISKFHMIDIQPDPDEILEVAQATKEQLAGSLTDRKRAIPRRLPFALGKVAAFGQKNNPKKIGIEPLGWRGFNANYADIGADGTRGTNHERLAVPIFIREANLCLGAISNGFSRYDQYSGFNSINPYNRTPHLTVAEKQRGGSISESELAALSAIVNESMPDSGEFELFDPVIYTKLGVGSVSLDKLLVRPARTANLFAVPALRDLAS